MKQDTTRSAGTITDSSGHILVCRLALERCEQDVAHLRALLHFGQMTGQGPCVFMAGIQKILTGLSQELRHSIESLSLSD